jgi:hypothetical protein
VKQVISIVNNKWNVFQPDKTYLVTEIRKSMDGYRYLYKIDNSWYYDRNSFSNPNFIDVTRKMKLERILK